MHPIQDAVVLRPDRRKARRQLALCTLVFVLVVPFNWIQSGPAASVVIAAPAFLALVFLLASLVRSRVVVTPAQLIVQTGLRRRRWPREHIARLLRAEVVHTPAGTYDTLYVLDERGAQLFVVNTGLYPTRDIDRLVDALAVPCSGPKGPIAVSELVELHPGIPTRAQRHPYLFLTAIVVAVVPWVAVVMWLVR